LSETSDSGNISGLFEGGAPVLGAGFASGMQFSAKLVLATAIASASLGFSGSSLARGLPADTNTVSLSDLPAQARKTHELIHKGGPFPYEKDGTVFNNRERLLPREPRGFYREYTVRTPGASNRGARRIVCGGRQPERPQSCYYTADHYASFSRIVP
jgi:ribonuclease T1